MSLLFLNDVNKQTMRDKSMKQSIRQVWREILIECIVCFLSFWNISVKRVETDSYLPRLAVGAFYGCDEKTLRLPKTYSPDFCF